MTETGGAGGIDRTLKVTSEGASEVEAEGLCGTVAGESGLMGGAEVAVGEEAVGSGGTGNALIGSIGSRVKLVKLPVRGRGARLGAVGARESGGRSN